MTRRAVVLSAVAVAGLAAGSAFWFAMPGAAEPTAIATPAPQAPKVSVVKAKRRDVTARVTVSGTLVPREEVYVLPEIDGLVIEDILAEEGDHVREGQVLARLSRATLDVQLAQNAANLARNAAAIAQVKAQISEAEANQIQAASALERAAKLKTSGITTLDTFEQRQAASRAGTAKLQAAKDGLAAAEADKKLTEAQRAELEIKLARTEIKAPRAGLISRRNAKLGSVAAMAGDPLFKIIADGAVELEAEAAEAELPRIKAGQSASVTAPGGDAVLAGTVRLVSPEVDKATRLGHVRISLPAGAPLAIGSFARGQVEVGRHTGVTLPVQAVIHTKDGAQAQVVKDGRIETRAIRLGLVGEGFAEIVSGLQDGETVVARAGPFVRDGDMVTAVPEAEQEARR